MTQSTLCIRLLRSQQVNDDQLIAASPHGGHNAAKYLRGLQLLGGVSGWVRDDYPSFS